MGGTSLGSTALASRQGTESARWTMNMLPSGQTPVMLADPEEAALRQPTARMRARPNERQKRAGARTIENTPNRNREHPESQSSSILDLKALEDQ
jgi:hypothetical protein